MTLEIWPALTSNWASPAIVFFGVGVAARALGTPLQFPKLLRTSLILLVLLALGFRTGVALGEVGLRPIWKQVLASIAFGAAMPFWMWPVWRYVARQSPSTSGVGAVQFSVGNVATFAATLGYLKLNHEFTDDLSAGFLVLLPFPALVMGSLLTAWMSGVRKTDPWWRPITVALVEGTRLKELHLFAAGLVAGYFVSRTNNEVFTDGMPTLVPWIGALLLFDLGLLAGSRWREIRQIPWFPLAFAAVAPVFNAGAALYLARRAHLGAGMATLLVTVAATGAVALTPSVLQRIFPGANNRMISTLQLVVVLPLNLLVGIPVYWQLAHRYVS
ncbi:MAG TPA: sodium-dependent bicarbonate transport family permease [Candidatus Limnocylindria bacterium]|jgi:hypothetical protein|nr:sodium-dependent bicarbonate transport family permease [Candidatus Limnocylindria bacterium]